MKTHELAHALSQLSKALRAGPNIDLGDISIVQANSQDNSNISSNIAVSLHSLVELSRIDKQQWLAVIEEYKFPITVRARDASRDILGKLLNYLEQNAEAREQLKNSIDKKPGKASPELLKALGVLLKE